MKSLRIGSSPVSFGLVAGLLFFAAAALWALASPIGSVPDEPSHMVRAAAAAEGEFDLKPSRTATGVDEATVPAYVAGTFDRVCFAFDSTVSAACPNARVSEDESQVLTITSAGNNAPGYYLAVGWPTRVAGGDAALYGMRLASAALCAGLFGWAGGLLRVAAGGRWTTAGLALAVTPMTVYLAGSVNPNGAEVLGALGVLVGLVTLLMGGTPRASRRSAVALTAVSGAVVASGRTFALIWILIACVVAFILCGRDAVASVARTRLGLMAGFGLGLSVALGIAWWWRVTQTAGAAAPPPNPVSPASAFVTLLLFSVDYARAYVGQFGWLDTDAPAATYAVFAALLAAWFVSAVAITRGRLRWLVVGLLAAVVVLPAVLQAALAPMFGFIWQGRYLLGLVVIAIVVAGMLHDAKGAPVSPPITLAYRVAAVSFALAHVATFGWVLRRYITGTSATIEEALHPAWQPPGGWILLTAAFTCVATAAAWLTFRASHIGDRDEVDAGAPN